MEKEQEKEVVDSTEIYKYLKEQCRLLRVPWFDEDWDSWNDFNYPDY